MEHVEEALPLETAAPATTLCAGCETPLGEPAPRTPFCPDCREKFIRFPIPLWIKAFGVGILVLLAFCLYRFPEHLQTGVHFKRGKAAAESHNYHTAQQEFGLTVERAPGFLEAQCRLLLAAFHNDDFTTAATMATRLEGKNIEDNDLYNEITGALNTMSRYIPSDSFNLFTEHMGLPADSIPAEAYTSYIQQHPGDDYAVLRLASAHLNADNNTAADSMTNTLLEKDPAFRPALAIKITAKRELLQFDSAHYFVAKLLAENHEDQYAINLKARILLKQKKDKEALALAKQGYSLNESDGYSAVTLAMAYHFNGDAKHREALLQKAESDSSNARYVTLARDYISGRKVFRN